MRYIWAEPLRMDNAKLVSTLGAESHTPIVKAVRRTLEDMGCLPGDHMPLDDVSGMIATPPIR
jgi:hypothetical protein